MRNAILVSMPIRIRAKTAPIINQGLITETIINTDMALKIPMVAKVAFYGMTKSSTFISLEKRVIILPIGLESKKTILALKTAFVMA